MHSLVNVQVGESEDRTLLTGVHTVSEWERAFARLLSNYMSQVADIYCLGCGVTLGWTYLRAYEPSQRYKEGKSHETSECLFDSLKLIPGKYIVETQRVIKENDWALAP